MKSGSGFTFSKDFIYQDDYVKVSRAILKYGCHVRSVTMSDDRVSIVVNHHDFYFVSLPLLSVVLLLGTSVIFPKLLCLHF